MSRPVYRYMRKKQFEKAPLATLMERITQMRVVPDLLPLDTKPVVDVGIRMNGRNEAIEPGVFTKPEEVRMHAESQARRHMCSHDVDRLFNCPKSMWRVSIRKLAYTHSSWLIPVYINAYMLQENDVTQHPHMYRLTGCRQQDLSAVLPLDPVNINS